MSMMTFDVCETISSDKWRAKGEAWTSENSTCMLYFVYSFRKNCVKNIFANHLWNTSLLDSMSVFL